MTTQPTPRMIHGVVKQVLSGDSIIIRDKPRGGPPQEKTVGLSGIAAPRLAYRLVAEETPQEPKDELINDKAKGSAPPVTSVKEEGKDEPYAWEAREFLRKKLIGKEVCFVPDRGDGDKTDKSKTGKEYGTVYLGRDMTGENVAESLVTEGLVDVRRTGIRPTEAVQRLGELEDIAKAAGKGKHGPDASSHVRNVRWVVENPRNFMDSFHQKPVKAIVERVRNGSTLRLVLLPDFYYITLMLSGIRCPSTGRQSGQGQGDGPAEPFADEAKFFTECRLLQRDVEVILESVSNQNFFGTVLHPNGNIAELLLSEGFARCVDWSLQFVTGGPEKLRAAEKLGKERRLRLFKDYVPSVPAIDAKDHEYQGKVVEVVNADALMVKLPDGSTRKIFLASIRPPRLPEDRSDIQREKGRVRPLYDIPYMYEAREFLRKKLIGKKVNVVVDYIQPPRDGFPERTCCTVTIGGVNVAEALVSKGLATVVRYRADDDQRSSHYDELLAAETKALKSGKGLHSKKESPPHRVVDLSGDLSKSKQFLPFLQRAGRMEAVVEFVASGSRLRVYVPRENCLMTFLLAGISCPRATRNDLRSGPMQGEPWGDEALAFTKDLCMQREVEIEVEAMDKAGNFIGWLWIEGANLAVSLVHEGFAEIHVTAERSPHYRALQQAENEAKSKKTRMWENHVPVETEVKEEDPERKYEPKAVQVTEVRSDLSFFAQHNDDGPKLIELLKQLRHDLTTNAPLPGAYVPRKNDLCAAIFSEDGQWYRAKVEKVDGKSVLVAYIDYGNREYTQSSKLAALPMAYHGLPPAAKEYNLAFISVPKDPESAEDAKLAFFEAVDGVPLLLNVEYKSGSIHFVTLTTADDSKTDIGKSLVENGFLLVEKRREKRFQKIVNEYLTAQDLAKKNRMNLWHYGDITEDDAKEFG